MMHRVRTDFPRVMDLARSRKSSSRSREVRGLIEFRWPQSCGDIPFQLPASIITVSWLRVHSNRRPLSLNLNARLSRNDFSQSLYLPFKLIKFGNDGAINSSMGIAKFLINGAIPNWTDTIFFLLKKCNSQLKDALEVKGTTRPTTN